MSGGIKLTIFIDHNWPLCLSITIKFETIIVRMLVNIAMKGKTERV